MSDGWPQAPSIIDSHVHFLDIGRFTYPWMPPGTGVLRRDYLPGHLIAEMQTAGASRAVLVEALDSAEETRFLLELAGQHRWIAGVVGWADLADPEVGRKLKLLAATARLVGIRHQVESEPDDRWLLRPEVLGGLREVAAVGLPFDLVLSPRHLPAAIGAARAIPDLHLVLDHLGKPPIASGQLEPWKSDVSRLAQFPNTWCKISGLVTEAGASRVTAEVLEPYVRHAVREFGSDRIMWGSDWPVCLKAATYGEVVRMAQELLGGRSSSDAAAFWAGTACRVYHLPAPDQRRGSP